MNTIVFIPTILYLVVGVILDDFEVVDREMRGDVEVACNMRLSENSRCVIVMTNLAFAPEGRKREKEK